MSDASYSPRLFCHRNCSSQSERPKKRNANRSLGSRKVTAPQQAHGAFSFHGDREDVKNAVPLQNRDKNRSRCKNCPENRCGTFRSRSEKEDQSTVSGLIRSLASKISARGRTGWTWTSIRTRIESEILGR